MNMHPVYTEERDIRRPFLSFFANRDIDDGEELTFRYDTQAGEELSSSASESALEGIKVEAAEQLQFRPPGTEVTVKTSDRKHNLTSMKCNCGATTCTGTVYRLRGAN